MTPPDPTPAVWRPRARIVDLTVEDHGDGVRIFDRRTEEAHELGATAGRLWRAADGSRTVPELVEVVVAEGMARQLAEELVDVALSDLEERDLLLPPLTPVPKVSRRDVLARLGVASAVAVGFGIASCVPTTTPAPTTTGTEKPTKATTAKPSK